VSFPARRTRRGFRLRFLIDGHAAMGIPRCGRGRRQKTRAGIIYSPRINSAYVTRRKSHVQLGNCSRTLRESSLFLFLSIGDSPLQDWLSLSLSAHERTRIDAVGNSSPQGEPKAPSGRKIWPYLPLHIPSPTPSLIK